MLSCSCGFLCFVILVAVVAVVVAVVLASVAFCSYSCNESWWFLVAAVVVVGDVGVV